MTSVMPWERPGSKIDARHVQRLAVIYVLQSTRQQLVDHQESIWAAPPSSHRYTRS
jgi:hypothetical protein